MPGYLAFDFGDMLRSNCCPTAEDEKDMLKIEFNKNFVNILRSNYIEALAGIITKNKSDALMKGAATLIFEQAIRFLGDYLNGDQYYPVNYETHNLIRARNQVVLMQEIGKHEA